MKTTTAELTSSRTQIQRAKAVIVTGSCHLRIEPGGNITVHTPLACFLLPLPAFTRKHAFPPTKFLHVSWNIFPLEKKNRKSMQRSVFFKCTHCSSFSLFSQFTSKRWACNSQKKTTFYYHVLFQGSVSVIVFACWYTYPAGSYGYLPCVFCVFVFFSGLIVWLHFWPLHSLQRESPGLAARSMDMSWWKTWVTRFMAIRAADENGKARGGFEKKKNECFFPLFFFISFQRGDRRWGIQICQEAERKK